MRSLKYALLFLLVLSAGLTFAQNQQAKKYNDKIISEQHKVTPKMIKFYQSFKTASLEDLQKQRTMLVSMLDKSLKKIKAMDGFENDTKLRDGAVELLEYEKSNLENEFKAMIPLIANKQRSKEDNEKLEKFKNELISKEEEMDSKFAKIQEDFTARHKLIPQKQEIK
ncbi:MAG: hypothetical protein ACJ75J_04015 [Cytophagaceae bacterium]